MLAIYKKELKTYLTSMIGFVFIFFVLLLTGIYFTAYNISMGYPLFSATLNTITFIFLILIPVLTMRVIAEEKKNKTDQLLFTAPVSVADIVIGKYLALLTIYFVPILIMCVYPLIMSMYGTVSFPMAYTAILGFFCLGCADIAIGVFISSVTESQVIAAVLSFVVLLVCYLMSGIEGFFSESASGTYFSFTVLIIIVAVVIYIMTREILIAAGVAALCEVALTIIYFMKSSWLEGKIQTVLEVFNISNHFSDFTNGILDIGSIVYFLSIIIMFIFLTMQSIQKRRWS